MIPKIHLLVGEKGCCHVNALKGIAVIVDALRASSTLAALFDRGVEEVWVVTEPERAWSLKERFPDACLIGERGSLKISGFDFSNSPTEILRAKEIPKRVVFTSTTGAQRILACRDAKAVLVGAAVNATGVARVASLLMERYQCDLILIAAGVIGKGEEWALEDIAAAWAIADRLGYPRGQTVSEVRGNLREVFEGSPHGQELLRLGLRSDVHWCAQEDAVMAVPYVVRWDLKAALLQAIFPRTRLPL